MPDVFTDLFPHAQNGLKKTNLGQQNNHTNNPVVTSKPDENQITIRCHFCQHRFDSIYSLNEHTAVAHTELLETGEMLNEDDILTRAIEISDFNKVEQVANQEAKQVYCCSLCESSFSSPKALKHHVSSSHVIQPPTLFPVSCKYCDIHFITRSTLAKHYEVSHPDEAPIFKCPQCVKTFKTAKSLQRHEITHAGVKLYQCGQCQAKFYWGEALHRHVKACKQRQSRTIQNQIASQRSITNI